MRLRCKRQVVGSKGHRNSGWIGSGVAINGTANTIVLPVSASWNIFDQEPYSIYNRVPHDGTGAVLATAANAAIGGGGCTLSGTVVRLGLEASGIDSDYNGRYIKFTSGNCMNRWTKITAYTGAGFVGSLPLRASSTATQLDLTDEAGQTATADFYKGGTVCITKGAQAGACRVISAYVQTSGSRSLTVAAFAGAPDTTSFYKIIGATKCATLQSPWSDGGSACTSAAGDTYKLMGGWTIVVTGGTCLGQFSRLADFTPFATGGGVVTLAPAVGNAAATGSWATSSQVNSGGPFKETTGLFGEGWSYTACTAPDNTTRYVLVPERKAPGSIDSTDDSFSVRWAGFVKPSATTQYTFQAIMPDAAAGQERVRVWVDNLLLIDQVILTSYSVLNPIC